MDPLYNLITPPDTTERLAFCLQSGKENRKRSGHAANFLTGSGWFSKVKKS